MRVGWFEEYGFILHGYGKEIKYEKEAKIVNEGLFQSRVFKKNHATIDPECYDPVNSYIAQQIVLDNYFITHQQAEQIV